MPFSYEIFFWNSICFLLHILLKIYIVDFFFLTRYEVFVWDLCCLAVMKCHEISSWGFMLLGLYAISWWLSLFCFLLDNCLVRFHVFFSRHEIYCWGFLLFAAYFFLIYVFPKSPIWNASKSLRIFECDYLDVTWPHALVVRGFVRGFRLVTRGDVKACMGVSSGEGGGDGIWRRGIMLLGLMRFHAFLRFLYEITWFLLQNFLTRFA